MTDKDGITGILVGRLVQARGDQIEGLTWSTFIVRRRKGVAAEKKKIGADMVIHASLKTADRSYSKGVLIQAKRVDPQVEMSKKAHAEMVNQCVKMLNFTPSSFVFDYTKGLMRCGPATRITGTTNRKLFSGCI